MKFPTEPILVGKSVENLRGNKISVGENYRRAFLRPQVSVVNPVAKPRSGQ